jgi:type IV pilus assembly protein PilY1
MSMFKLHRAGILTGLVAIIAAGAMAFSPGSAAKVISSPAQQAGAYALQPPLGQGGAAPLVMLNLSRDHQLFYKAYNDFSDLDGDGVLDTTYIASTKVTYAGYFDPTKCYTYDSSVGYFKPDAAATADHYCSGEFSGNFMNWASMSRMDEVRQILYGGKRYIDDAANTVLERAFLPTDAHSFAKYYGGSDMAKLVPASYVGNTTAPTQTADSTVIFDSQAFGENGQNYVLLRLQGVSIDVAVGDQFLMQQTSGNGTKISVTAPVRNLNTNGYNAKKNRVELRLQLGEILNSTCSTLDDCVTSIKKVKKWTITNLSRTGLTFCNTTIQDASNTLSQTTTSPPLIRAAKGNYALWGSNEKRQCLWTNERNNLQNGFFDGLLSNGNRAALSGLNSSAENPDQASTFNARVQVCVSGNIGSENCKQYPDAQLTTNPYKPVGLLQKYGETGEIKFGLVTPTFDKNISGGVLRKALPDPGTNDGDFISDEISPVTGQRTGNPGIISNIDALRIYGYSYANDDNYGTGDGCTFQQTGIAATASGTVVQEGNCSSWGNPMAESYVEALRYLAGKAPNAAFAQGTTGHDATLGLSLITKWNDPISSANFCAALNVININASSISYDTDQLSGYVDLNTGRGAVDWTNLIGIGEGISGKQWFVGNPNASYTGTDANLCSAKTVGNFGEAIGICPEVPALQGGYDIAGAAYGAHVNRIRNLGMLAGEPVVADDDRTSLKVSTFGVQLATNTPQIRVTVPGSTDKFVTIIPAYRLVLPSGAVGGGALVDFKVISQTSDGTTARGSFYADWEDSFAGGDYDQDMWGIISYEITSTAVNITTKPVAASTSNGQGFGYIISGTTQDGPHFHSGIYSFNYTDPVGIKVYDSNGVLLNGTTDANGSGINASGGCVSCTVDKAATTAKYTIGTTSAGTLLDPLEYAAKWGGFQIDTSKADGKDTPVNDTNPNDNSKWDADGDGVPDNYFLVTDPGKLETSLDTLFRKILAKIASGTAAAVVATSSNGVGLTYQALYEQEHKDLRGNTATWAGSLGALFTDSTGLLREDLNHNGQLDDYTVDPVITFVYQPGGQKTIAERSFSSDPKTFIQGALIPVELADIATVWNARTWLWDPNLKVDANRAYGDVAATGNLAAGGRYIFTWIDLNHNGKVDAGETLPFEWSSFSGTYSADSATGFRYRFLNSDDGADGGEANKIVNWMRGAEVAGMRNRTVDYDDANPGRILRLGDIINSTPLVVSTPAESYDLLYNDTSYASFRSTYRSRRQMVYVGANDGMIHAFNGGFYNTSCQEVSSQPDSRTCTAAAPNPTKAFDSGFANHPLGAEIWAYVPGNVLPHLRWLTDPKYQHTYYVDGSAIAFDAKVFTADSTHVEGWGTIMVVPFRLGGGTITVDTSDPASSTRDNRTSESSYVILDITNPEVAPTVLAELTAPNMRTTSTPAVIVVRDVPTGSPNKFFLATGSGPTDAKRVASSGNLSVSVFDMASVAAGTVTPVKSFDLGATGVPGAAQAVKSFPGDLIASDYDLNGLAESLYFGSVRDTGGDEFGGGFWKVAINGNADPTKWTPSLMVDLSGPASTSTATNGRPVTIRPTLGRNNRGAPMVFFGTGRLFNSNDKATSAPQRIYGVIDTSLLATGDIQATALPLGEGNLANVTNINVFTDGSIGGSGIPGTADSFTQLGNVFDTAGVLGWYRDLDSSGTNPSERVVSSQTLLGSVLLTNTYVPGTSICTGLGTSAIFGLNYKTGTADPGLSYFGGTPVTGGKTMVNPSTSLGQGLPAPPALHVGGADGSDKKITACVQTSTGAIVCKDITTLSPVTSGESSWREPTGN